MNKKILKAALQMRKRGLSNEIAVGLIIDLSSVKGDWKFIAVETITAFFELQMEELYNKLILADK